MDEPTQPEAENELGKIHKISGALSAAETENRT